MSVLGLVSVSRIGLDWNGWKWTWYDRGETLRTLTFVAVGRCRDVSLLALRGLVVGKSIGFDWAWRLMKSNGDDACGLCKVDDGCTVDLSGIFSLERDGEVRRYETSISWTIARWTW